MKSEEGGCESEWPWPVLRHYFSVYLEGFWKATNATVRNQELSTITRVYSVSLCLYTHDLQTYSIYKGKGKVILLRARCDPKGG